MLLFYNSLLFCKQWVICLSQLSEILSEILSFLPLCSKMPEFGQEPNGSQISEIFRHSDAWVGTCLPSPPLPRSHDAFASIISSMFLWSNCLTKLADDIWNVTQKQYATPTIDKCHDMHLPLSKYQQSCKVIKRNAINNEKSDENSFT